MSVPVSNIEELYVAIKRNNVEIILGTVYIPPSSPLEVYEAHFSSLEYIYTNIAPLANIIILGYYNCPGIAWNTNNETYKNLQEQIILENIFFFDLHQYNSVYNCNNNTLDLALSNNSNITVNPATEPLLPIDSYHPPLLVLFNTAVINYNCNTLSRNNISLHNFRKCDYDKLNDYFGEVNWDLIFTQNNNDVNTCLDIFYTILSIAINKFIPKKNENSNKFPHWFSKLTIKLVRKKNRLYKDYKRSKNPTKKEQYENLRREVKQKIDSDYKRFINMTENNIQSNIKSFWKYVNSKKKDHSYIPNTMQFNDMSATTGESIANLFSDFFLPFLSHPPINHYPAIYLNALLPIYLYLIYT